MEPNPFHHPWKQRRLPGFDYATPDHAVFVTVRAHGSSAPFSNPRLAQLVLSSLEWLRSHRGVSLYAFCLMPDHLHLLLRLGGGTQTLGLIIGSFKRFTTRQSWQ